MVGFILTGHGEFAPGLASALSLVAGEQEAFEVVPFKVEDAAGFSELIAARIAEMRSSTEGVLVFCDLLGGTPFNQAMMATQATPDVRVVCGANLPMLIETLFARNAGSASGLAELVDVATNAGKGGIASPELELGGDEDDD